MAACWSSRPQKQVDACVPHADGFDRSAACPQELSLLSTRRLVRADCRPDTHLNRPPDPASRLRAPQGTPRFALVRFAGHARRRLIALSPTAPGRSIRNPRALGPGIVAATRIQPCAMKTVMTRPSPGWTGIDYSFLGPKSIHEKQKHDHEFVNTHPVVAGLVPGNPAHGRTAHLSGMAGT